MYDELTPAVIEEKLGDKQYNEEAMKNNEKNARENNQGDAKENNQEDVKENNKENAKEVEQKKDQPKHAEYSIAIENGSAKWLDYEREDTLQNINIKVRPGELIAIVGQVGAGKSSLLNVILKELRLQEGSIQVCWRSLFNG